MSRMKRLFAAALLACLAGPAQAGKDCTCRHEGRDVAEGQTACLRTAKGPTLARCVMVLNNTSWEFLDRPCPQASTTPMPAAG